VAVVLSYVIAIKEEPLNRSIKGI